MKDMKDASLPAACTFTPTTNQPKKERGASMEESSRFRGELMYEGVYLYSNSSLSYILFLATHPYRLVVLVVLFTPRPCRQAACSGGAGIGRACGNGGLVVGGTGSQDALYIQASTCFVQFVTFFHWDLCSFAYFLFTSTATMNIFLPPSCLLAH